MNMSDGQQFLDVCPSRDELMAFGTGRLAQPALDGVAKHIEAPCSRCEAVLEELVDQADPLLADLRERPAITAAEAEDACRCVLEHVLGPDVSTTAWVPPSSPSTLDRAPLDLPGYETPKLLGMGGMGVVWGVRDLQFERPLALKVMKADGANSDRVCHFLDEARITAQLAHPSIVPVHALGRLADGRPYYTMKLVEGQTLAEILQAEPDLASRRTELLLVFARVCEALAFAHSKRVIHLDLKPSNVMVGAHREVQVMDWGLAKLLDESDNQLGVAGTWPYMSREQANGRFDEVDRRSDVFGLGGMLCAILTGKPPYDGPTPADVIRQAKEADLTGAYARLEGCGADAELIGLARACLSAEPKARPDDASVVEERLTGYLASVQERLDQAKVAEAEARARAEQEERTAEAERQKAEAERQARKLAEKARRRMLWGTASAGLFLVALLAAGFFAWRDHEARQKHLADILDRALTAAMSGDLDTAEQATAEAERAGASTGQVHMLRGQIALHRGQSRKARHHLEEAVRLLPQSVSARGLLAVAYAYDGHWERYNKAVGEMARLTPLTPEDFLFKGYAEARLEPTRGLQTIKQAFDSRPMSGIALLIRAEVRALVAQDTDDLEEAEGAVQDAKYARELLRDNPATLWMSLAAHLVKAGVHEHREEWNLHKTDLELARKYVDALKTFTALPEAVACRWLYFREVDRAEEVLGDLCQASEQTHHVYITFSYALTLYRRGQPGDFKEALRVLKKQRPTYNDRLLPFVLAEHDWPDKHDWPARARKAAEDFTASSQDGAAVMNAQAVLCLLGNKRDAVEASRKLQQEQPGRFFTLRPEPILRCLRYNASEISADDLVRGAKGSRWDECRAHFCVAMTKLAEGDRTWARKHFDMAVKTRAFLESTYDMSWVFQARLAKDPTWPPWIKAGRAK
jgi:tetratricopeptide (TPR) repeat protein